MLFISKHLITFTFSLVFFTPKGGIVSTEDEEMAIALQESLNVMGKYQNWLKLRHLFGLCVSVHVPCKTFIH